MRWCVGALVRWGVGALRRWGVAALPRQGWQIGDTLMEIGDTDLNLGAEIHLLQTLFEHPRKVLSARKIF
jgi:hypothetical protein